MKKVLIVSNFLTQIIKFNMGNIEILSSLGFEVHVACNIEDTLSSSKMMNERFLKQLEEKNVAVHHIPFGRRIKAQLLFYKPYKCLVNLVKENNFSFIHCHSPIGGLCSRLACKKMKIPCMYTAHGFLFFKGSSIFHWIFSYLQEKILARFTDCLITIAKEDYFLANKSFKAGKICYIHGVGVDLKSFSSSVDNSYLLSEFDISNQYIVLSIGEINKNKNHISVIKALEESNIKNWKYIICGEGSFKTDILKYLAKNHLTNNVCFAGYRDDIPNICNVADLYIHPSYREGISVALMEGIASKKPTICSNIRGNKDLITNDGWRFNPKSLKEIIHCINKAYSHYDIKDIEENYNTLLNYDSDKVNCEMTSIYQDFIAKMSS